VAALGPIPSEDGSAVLFNVILVKDSDQTATLVDPLDAIQTKYSTGGTNFYMLGEPTSTADFKKISEDDLKKGETIGVLVAIIVLLIVFGSLIAGVTPIIMGIFAIGVAFRRRRSARRGVALELLRSEPDLDDGPRGRDRLLVVHRVALPRGTAARAGTTSRRSGWPARRPTAPSSSAGSPW
jgi:hypothetical protein